MSQAKIQAALELGVSSMEGLIPSSTIVSSTSGSPAVFETVAPHLLTSGVCVTIKNHTSINGQFKCEVVNEVKFRLKTLDTSEYLSAGLAGYDGTVSANLIEWENASFTPTVGVPYQRVHVMFAEPENPTFGSDHVRESGFLQITLNFPKQVGTGDVMARVDMIKSKFKRGATFSYAGYNVVVTKSPEKIGGAPLDQSYAVAVRVPFRCDVYS